jgi:hypothetical protein
VVFSAGGDVGVNPDLNLGEGSGRRVLSLLGNGHGRLPVEGFYLYLGIGSEPLGLHLDPHARQTGK